jgi:hypothetical protein
MSEYSDHDHVWMIFVPYTVNSFYSGTFYRNALLIGTLLTGPTDAYYILYMIHHFL